MSTASTRRSTSAPTPAAGRVVSRREEAKTLFRNAILEAAEGVFAERGFHRARIQDVAERARIGVGTVYNHFDEKEDLLRALLEERTEALLAELDRRPEDPSGFEAGLVARIDRMLRYVETHRAFFALAAEHGAFGASSASAAAIGGKAARSIARARATFVRIVEEGVTEGALEPIETSRLARTLGGIVRAFTLGAIEDGRTDLAADAALVVRLFVHGASRSAPRASKRSR